MKLKFTLVIILLMESFPIMAEMNLAEMDVKEGEWEINTQMEMQGPVQLAIQPITVKQCFTKKEDMTPDKLLNNKHCEMLKMDISENTVSWKMRCNQAGMQMEGQGDLTYQKTSFDGHFKMMMAGSKQGAININTKLNGRYIGACK